VDVASTEVLASEFAQKENGATQRPEEEHAAPFEGIPAVTLLEGLIRQEAF
jgi:hypothetical protein